MWVRGLKPGDFKLTTELAEVAPRVGAWIETYGIRLFDKDKEGSHPVWVRGLKLSVNRP